MQLSLFDAPFIGYNKAIDALLKLDCSEPRKRLKRWQKSFPGHRDLSIEFGFIDFLCQNQTMHALENDPLSALHLWDKDWEKVFEDQQDKRKLLGLFRKSYFKKIGETILALEKKGEEIQLADLMLCLLRGEYYSDVIRVGKRLAASEKAGGRVLGYLADALFQTGQVTDAMSTYLAAAISDPDDIDIKALCHEEVKRTLTAPHQLIEEFLGEAITFTQKPIAQWAAPTGLLTGLFKTPRPSREWQPRDLYSHLKKGRERNCHAGKPGTTFARCIILSEQGLYILSEHGIDIAEVRATMKEIHETLFSIYMKKMGSSTRQQCLSGFQT